MSKPYYEMTMLVERLHRHFLDVLRSELRRVGVEDLNAVQALLLYNIGGEDVVIRDLKDRGYYQGSNVSYNIKKLTEMGYLAQERSEHDRRSVRLSLTDRGWKMANVVKELQGRLAAAVGQEDDLANAVKTMQRLERLWTDYIRYGDIAPAEA